MQNLVWGATQPFAGMLADKYGSGRVVLGGVLLYVLGLAFIWRIRACRGSSCSRPAYGRHRAVGRHVWYLAIALGIVAGLLNLPIDEGEIRRTPALAA